MVPSNVGQQSGYNISKWKKIRHRFLLFGANRRRRQMAARHPPFGGETTP
jgi:hypothetical protein